MVARRSWKQGKIAGCLGADYEGSLANWNVSVRIFSVLARTMAGVKDVLVGMAADGESVEGCCWRQIVGAANGAKKGLLEEREGKDVVGVEGKDAGSNDEAKEGLEGA